jgi:heat shock protein HslJ
MKKALILALFTAISACILPDRQSEIVEPPLEGTIWMLKHIGNKEIAKSPTQPFIKFENGTFQGFGGCNQFNGSYTVEKNRLRVKQITATEMFCEAIDTEELYLSSLQRATRYQILTDQMLMADGEKPLLLFKSRK